MNIRETILAITAGFALLAQPAFSGGLVLSTEEGQPDEGRVLPVLLLGLVVAALILGGGDPCNGADPAPTGGC